MHCRERDHGMVDIISRPGHLRNVVSPKLLACATADGRHGLRDELVIKWQGNVPRIEKSVISYVERTGGVAGHSPLEHGFCRKNNR